MSEEIELTLNKGWVKALIFILGTSLNIAFSMYKTELIPGPKLDSDNKQFQKEIRDEISAIREDLASIKGELRGQNRIADIRNFN